MAELPQPAFDPDEARRVVEDVLSRPEYADLQPGLLERALGAVFEQVGRALATLEGTGLGTAAGVVVLVVALVALTWLLVRWLGGVQREAVVEVAPADEVGRSREDWLGDADRHEREGRLREAVRCRYRALVALLAERGVVEEVPGRTTGEYLEQVRERAGEAAAAFTVVTVAFERAWYGHGAVGPEELERLRADEQAVARAVAGDRRMPVGAP